MIGDPMPPVALLITHEIEKEYWQDKPTLRVTCRPVVLIDNQVRNPGDTGETAGLADLILSAHLNAAYIGSDITPTLWSWRPEYRQPFAVDLMRAEAMVKTLRKIDAHAARVAARYGDPATFAQRAIRFGDAIGARTYYEPLDAGVPGGYDALQPIDAATAIGRMDLIVARFIEAQKVTA